MSTKKKLLTALSILIVIFIIYKLEKQSIHRPVFNVEYIQHIVESFGILGILVYILINSIRPFLFIPTTIMFISGGVIFGTIRGSIYTLTGLMVASSLSFFLARRFQKPFKKIFGNKYLSKINSLSNDQVIRGLFVMRVSPAFPFDPVSYGSGISHMSYKQFCIGTLLGAFPKVILYTFLGDQINNIFSLQTLIVFVILLILALCPYFFRKKPQAFNK
ncbi:TVP38/TMEM64 family protein [Alkaliphilus sp. B6464]|uniref:TVP38/TMEM64 family protein n=1 Tax=Alkaliphilus sp. B6464 TaxID=2731219 RepID=UPI001BA45384|nr:TVP38/TMEM64 family protein [Alkaliphilus sp. B6464]QUH19441.1 TVP38/TMEM64 family protein [Alkaliphilus sp. B6464]